MIYMIPNTTVGTNFEPSAVKDALTLEAIETMKSVTFKNCDLSYARFYVHLDTVTFQDTTMTGVRFLSPSSGLRLEAISVNFINSPDICNIDLLNFGAPSTANNVDINFEGIKGCTIYAHKEKIYGSGDKNWYSFQPKVTDSNSNVVFPISEEISIEGYHLYDNGISNIKNIVDDLGITSFQNYEEKITLVSWNIKFKYS